MMNERKNEPKSSACFMHPSFGCIHFNSYPSEYTTFESPTPLKVIYRPQFVKASKRRKRLRRTNSHSKHNVPDLWKPNTFCPAEPQYGNTNIGVNIPTCMESISNNIINLNQTESQIDNMPFGEYADYVSKVSSLGRDIKQLPSSNHEMLQSSYSFAVQNSSYPTNHVYFQGTPLAATNLAYALKPVQNTWFMLKPYMVLKQNVYNPRVFPAFQNYIMEWQIANNRLMFYLIKTIFKLGRVNVFQVVSETTNIIPCSKIIYTGSNTIVEFSDVSKQFQTNCQIKPDPYFNLNPNEVFCARKYLNRHQQELLFDNKRYDESFVNFPQSDLKYLEADSYLDVTGNEACNLTFVDYQKEGEVSVFSNSKFQNTKEEENRFFTFSPKESIDIKEWSDKLLTKTKETSSSAFPKSDSYGTSTENARMLPKTNNELKYNPIVVVPKTDFNIQMKNYRYPVEFTHKTKNIHVNVKKLLNEDKLTKINVPSSFQMKIPGKQEKPRLNSLNFSDHETF